MNGAVYINIIKWLESIHLPCPVKHFFKIDCPGCGLQRSLIALLKGNLQLSFHYHPATIPLLLFFLFAGLHLKYRFKQGNKIIVCSYVIIVSILATNYIYKIIQL